MSGLQLQLVDIPATYLLTPRQQHALEHIQAAGQNGIHADELGAHLCEQRGIHPAGDRCEWCGSNGKDVLEALKRKGLVRLRRPRGQHSYWQAVELPAVQFGDFPDGY